MTINSLVRKQLPILQRLVFLEEEFQNIICFESNNMKMNTLQLHQGTLRAGGTRHYLQLRSLYGVYNGHNIDSVIEAFPKVSPTNDFKNRILQAITPRF